MTGLFSRHGDVERHFSGGGSPSVDRRMFRHLEGCTRCRDQYRTLAMLEALEAGGGDQARDRLARGVFGSAGGAAAPRRRVLAGSLTVAFACLALVVTVGRKPAPFTARGGAGSAALSGAALGIYRVPHDPATEALAPADTQRAGATFRAGESLAFTYVNPPSVGATSLMVFGRDAAGHVYWFWPAWNDAADDPTSVAIIESATPVELKEAVRHPLAAGPLTIVGLFTPRPLHVREVEAAVANGLGGLQAFEGHVWAETLEVMP